MGPPLCLGRSMRLRSHPALVVLACLAVGMLWVPPAPAAPHTATASLTLQVRPEARLDQEGAFLRVKIRLARGADARLWSATACGAPLADTLVISRSGTHTIPLSALGAPAGENICLASSDGTLRLAQPVQSAWSASAATDQLERTAMDADLPR
jgi:hypothetical protein